MTLTTVLIDISAVSVLLFLAFLIRQKIPFFYKYYFFHIAVSLSFVFSEFFDSDFYDIGTAVNFINRGVV